MLATLGGIALQASGRLGGMVFSHNKGGVYVRNGTIPTNPNTTAQQAARANLAVRSQEWAGLTVVQRLAWVQYSKLNPVINRLGRKTILSGHMCYVQINTRLNKAGDSLLVDPPISAPPTPLLTLIADGDIGAGDTDITYTTSPTAANIKVWVRAALIDSAGINHVENRFRDILISPAAQASPLDIETELTAIFGTLQIDQHLFVRAATFDSTTGLRSAFLQSDVFLTST